ncbi:MAG TPA: polysaccharide deacetylase family protein [Fimbriimonadaceae bacterium]|nr:polysaccharide deacetylase family protein [Fimbriimonadaceae bacterium]
MGSRSSWGPFLLAGFVGALGVVLAQKVLNRVQTQSKKTYALSDDILIHGNQNLKEVALTFDDGPRPELARPMLDLLGKHKARSTFFVVGQQVEKSPAIVRRMMNEGHEVANHTYSHPRLDGLSEDQIRTELAACNKAVFQATGAHTNLFRPPGMRYDEVVLRAAQDLGYVTVHWNVAAQDFKPQPSSEISRKVLKSVKPGSVILLHIHPDTLAALPTILDSLQNDGYRFVTVSQMLGRLQRPVVVKTNAYGAKPEPIVSKAELQRAVSKPSRPNVARLKANRAPTLATPPTKGVDVPTWN